MEWTAIVQNGVATFGGVLAAFWLQFLARRLRRRQRLKAVVADLWESLQANHKESARIAELLRALKRPSGANVELELWHLNRATFAKDVHDRSLRTGMARAFENVRYIGAETDKLLNHSLTTDFGKALAASVWERMAALQNQMNELEPVIRRFANSEKLARGRPRRG